MNTLKAVWAFFEGKKTYLVCVATIAYAFFGLYKGWVTSDQFVQLLSTAGIGAGIRNAK